MRHTTLLSLLALVSLEAFAQAGSLDSGFGDNGKVLLPFIDAGHNDQAVTALVLPDEKILVAGRSSNGDHFNSVLIRLNSDGSPDMTFGTQAVVHHDLAAGSEFIRSVTLDAQGRIVVGGHLFSDAAETNSDLFVARFLPDGTLDASFNGTGILIRDIHNTPDAEEAYEVLIQPDGRIVLCGFTGIAEEFTEIVIERYMDDGTLDPSFGGDGSVLVGVVDASGEQLRGAAMGTSGEIYFCGFGIRTGESDQSLLLGHVDAAGNSPSTFGNSNGHSWISEFDADLIARAIAVTPDGGLVAAGVQRTTGATQARVIYTFSATGIETSSSFMDNSNGPDAWNCLLVQNSGTILSGGDAGAAPNSRDWSVRRSEADLGVDATFDAEDHDEDGGAESCFDLEFTADSSVLGIGYGEVAGQNHIMLLKYRNDISSGVNEAANTPLINAFPNPTGSRSVISVGASSDHDPYAFRLVDAQGCTVQDWSNRPIGGGKFEIDLSSLAVGVYTLHARNAATRSSIKIVKR